MNKVAKDADPKELFAAALSWYDKVEEPFREFRDSPVGNKYRDAINGFIHDARRGRNNIQYALEKNELPEMGRVNRRWADYGITIQNIRLMELILELAVEGHGNDGKLAEARTRRCQEQQVAGNL